MKRALPPVAAPVRAFTSPLEEPPPVYLLATAYGEFTDSRSYHAFRVSVERSAEHDDAPVRVLLDDDSETPPYHGRSMQTLGAEKQMICEFTTGAALRAFTAALVAAVSEAERRGLLADTEVSA